MRLRLGRSERTNNGGSLDVLFTFVIGRFSWDDERHPNDSARRPSFSSMSKTEMKAISDHGLSGRQLHAERRVQFDVC